MTTIKLKNGSGAPTAGDLAQGEPALDLTNKRLYTEDSGGTVIEVGTNPGVDVTFADNRKAIFGAGSDLQIYHNGNHSFIEDSGTGNLYLRGTNLEIQSTAQEKYLAANANGGVKLYYDNSEKLATTSTGIDVMGTVTADGSDAGTGGVFVESNTAGVGARLDTIDATISNTASLTNSLLLDSDNHAIIRMDSNNNGSGDFYITESTSDTARLRIANNGDVSLFEDTGTTAKLFWDASAESLGIGETAPERTLHVNSAGVQIGALIESTSAIASRLSLMDANTTNSARVGIGATGDTLGLYAGGAVRATVDASGNVGIGTSSPQSSQKLHIANTSGNCEMTLQSSDSGVASLLFGDATDFSRGKVTYDNSSDSMAFQVNNLQEAMRIDSSGQVGIGTTSPQGPLHVYGGEYAYIGPNVAGVTPDSTTGGIAIGWNKSSGQGESIIAFNKGAGATGGLVFADNNGGTYAERMRIDSGGNLLVGTTDTNPTTGTSEGIVLGSGGIMLASNTSDAAIALNRTSTDGDIAIFKKNGTPVGSIGTVGGHLAVGGGDVFLEFNSTGDALQPMSTVTGGASNGAVDLGASLRRFKDLYLSGFAYVGAVDGSSLSVGDGSSVGLKFVSSGPKILPRGTDGTIQDGTIDLGDGNDRFQDIYATNGTIQTSDRNEKQDIEALSDAEQRVAVAAKGLLRKFRWIDMVEQKGDDARIHFGIIAQDLQDAFTAEGLDAGRYAMFINTTWTDEETGEERTRMGVRYSELLAFIIAAI
jgi:hypothetical protein